MIDELPPELRELVDAERAAPVEAAARVAVRSQIAATVGHLPLGVKLASGVGLKLLGSLLGVVAVVVLVRVANEPVEAAAIRVELPASEHSPAIQQRAFERAESARVPIAPPPRSVRLSPRGAPPPRSVRLSPRGAAVGTPPPVRVPFARLRLTEHSPARLSHMPDELPTEAWLLANAWRALERGKPYLAGHFVKLAATYYPRGVLIEERDALGVAVLAANGRLDEARAAAARFEVAYPGSIHRTFVQHALESEGAP